MHSEFQRPGLTSGLSLLYADASKTGANGRIVPASPELEIILYVITATCIVEATETIGG